jgi:hypothetical protein
MWLGSVASAPPAVRTPRTGLATQTLAIRPDRATSQRSSEGSPPNHERPGLRREPRTVRATTTRPDSAIPHERSAENGRQPRTRIGRSDAPSAPSSGADGTPERLTALEARVASRPTAASTGRPPRPPAFGGLPVRHKRRRGERPVQLRVSSAGQRTRTPGQPSAGQANGDLPNGKNPGSSRRAQLTVARSTPRPNHAAAPGQVFGT